MKLWDTNPYWVQQYLLSLICIRNRGIVWNNKTANTWAFIYLWNIISTPEKDISLLLFRSYTNKLLLE
jgi:hypothetical protein